MKLLRNLFIASTLSSNTMSFYDFYFKGILKESSFHITYLSTRKVLCVLILIALQTLLNLKKMIAFVDCKAEILLNELAPKIHFSSAVIRPTMSGLLRKQ